MVCHHRRIRLPSSGAAKSSGYRPASPHRPLHCSIYDKGRSSYQAPNLGINLLQACSADVSSTPSPASSGPVRNAIELCTRGHMLKGLLQVETDCRNIVLDDVQKAGSAAACQGTTQYQAQQLPSHAVPPRSLCHSQCQNVHHLQAGGQHLCLLLQGLAEDMWTPRTGGRTWAQIGCS